MSRSHGLNRSEQTLLVVATALGLGLAEVARLCFRSKAELVRRLQHDRRLARQVAVARRRGARLSHDDRARADPQNWRRVARRLTAGDADAAELLAAFEMPTYDELSRPVDPTEN